MSFAQLLQPWKLLGSGEFCSAYATTLDGQPVVVKLLKEDQRDNATALADLQSETYLMTSMRCVRTRAHCGGAAHPHCHVHACAASLVDVSGC